MNINSYKLLIQTYIGAYNRLDVDKMMSVLHENVQSASVNSSAKSKAEFRGLAEQAKLLFSERKQSMTNAEIDDKKPLLVFRMLAH